MSSPNDKDGANVGTEVLNITQGEEALDSLLEDDGKGNAKLDNTSQNSLNSEVMDNTSDLSADSLVQSTDSAIAVSPDLEPDQETPDFGKKETVVLNNNGPTGGSEVEQQKEEKKKEEANKGEEEDRSKMQETVIPDKQEVKQDKQQTEEDKDSRNGRVQVHSQVEYNDAIPSPSSQNGTTPSGDELQQLQTEEHSDDNHRYEDCLPGGISSEYEECDPGESLLSGRKMYHSSVFIGYEEIGVQKSRDTTCITSTEKSVKEKLEVLNELQEVKVDHIQHANSKDQCEERTQIDVCKEHHEREVKSKKSILPPEVSSLSRELEKPKTLNVHKIYEHSLQHEETEYLKPKEIECIQQNVEVVVSQQHAKAASMQHKEMEPSHPKETGNLQLDDEDYSPLYEEAKDYLECEEEKCSELFKSTFYYREQRNVASDPSKQQAVASDQEIEAKELEQSSDTDSMVTAQSRQIPLKENSSEEDGYEEEEEDEEDVSESEMVVSASIQFPLAKKADKEPSAEDGSECKEETEEPQANASPEINEGVTVQVQHLVTQQPPKEGTPSGCESDVEDNTEEDSKSISESSLPVPLASTPSRIPSSVQLPETVSRLDTPFGSSVFLVGTAHFSRESQEDVATTIRTVKPDIVVVELCKARTAILQLDEETILQESRSLDFKKVQMIMKQHGKIQGILYLLLLSLSAHITKQLGMAPGGEFRTAFSEARRSAPGCLIQLGDRPIQVTLSRALASLSLWHKVKLTWHILTSKEPISKEEVEKCKQRDFIEEMLAEMTGQFPAISEVFVKERDIYLCRSLQAAAQPVPNPMSPTGMSPRVVVGVVGIGHVPGIVEHWGKITDEDIPPIMRIPPPSLSGKILKVTAKITVYGLIGYGVYKCLPSAAKSMIHSSVQSTVLTLKSLPEQWTKYILFLISELNETHCTGRKEENIMEGMEKVIDSPTFAGTSTLPLNTDSRCRKQLESINDHVTLQSIGSVGEGNGETECTFVASESFSSYKEKSKCFNLRANKEGGALSPLLLAGELKEGECEGNKGAHSDLPASKKRRKMCEENVLSLIAPGTREEMGISCVKGLNECDKVDKPSALSMSDLVFNNGKKAFNRDSVGKAVDSSLRVSDESEPSTSSVRNTPEYIGCQQAEDEYEHVVCGLIYCASSFPGSSIDMVKFNADQIEGCKCVNTCSEDCTCIVQFGQPYKDGKLDAGYGINPIFECNDECGCDECCPNRLVQKGPLNGLEITLYSEKGFGVRTTYFIPQNSFVCEYAGELISIQEAKIRFEKQKENESNYILVLREHFGGKKTGPQITVIDPTVIGNLGRYINHSCSPNLIVVPVRIDSMVPVAALFAIRDIQPGEELCYDYDSSNNVTGASQLTANMSSLQRGRSSLFRELSFGDAQNITSTAVATSSGENQENYTQSGYKQQKQVMKKINVAHESGSKPVISKPCLCGSENCKVFLPVNNMLF
ncbi:uncharacterized protein LOC125043649 [Penaeus chinensis]|uniref:uncharacterized protein LOC125043649 n=1 Tax=Penaeus chinensis TaxID=139456 RepID=UPI001FB6C53D|nr:uncharacterized protein LOC125043649 [Penaeus chinensis]